MSTFRPENEPKKVVMNLRNCAVELRNGSDFEATVYSPNPQKVFEIIENDGVLTLNEPEDEQFTMQMVCNCDLSELIIDSINSNIFLNRIESQKVAVQSKYGDIEINGCRIKDCDLKTVSGTVIIENKSGFEALTINGEEGDVDLYIQGKNEKLAINTASGDVDVDIRGDFQLVEINSDIGDIFLKAREVEGIDLDVYTHYGLLDEKINRIAGKNQVVIKSEEGDIKLRHR